MSALPSGCLLFSLVKSTPHDPITMAEISQKRTSVGQTPPVARKPKRAFLLDAVMLKVN